MTFAFPLAFLHPSADSVQRKHAADLPYWPARHKHRRTFFLRPSGRILMMNDLDGRRLAACFLLILLGFCFYPSNKHLILRGRTIWFSSYAPSCVSS
jgi:hypothetical protein